MVMAKTKRLAKNPEIFRLADFPYTRVAPLDNFSILYKVTEELIIITAFQDNRQDPTKLLEILKAQSN